MNTPSSRLRIVHVCNFHYNRNGEKFDTMDQKIHLGFCENGHYVYPFPVHDISRQLSWTNSKRFGSKQANQSLIATCKRIQPDLLLLGHSQSIQSSTLETLKQNHPEMKIAMWFCDWFYSQRAFKYEFIFERLELLDAFFATTAGSKLDAFKSKNCQVHFLPNLTHPAVEKYRAFEQETFDYDVVFFGTDRKDPERREILTKLEESLREHLRIGIFGSLGREAVYGAQKEQILSQSKAALNLTRLPEEMPWYSSDRIANIMGNGLLACTRSSANLEEYYGPNTLLTYRDDHELISSLENILKSEKWRETARNGWEVAHTKTNAKTVTKTLLNIIFS